MRLMMRRIAAILSAALCTVLLSGCEMPEPSRFVMTDDAAQPIESDTDLTGTWIIPGMESVIEFHADGTYTCEEEKSTGTWTFMSGNENFAIADLFETVEYISLTDESGETFFSGAVLGDVISGYNEMKNVQRYFVRQNREPVPMEELVGNWDDMNSKKYMLELKADGSAATLEDEGSFTVYENDDYGTSIQTVIKDVETEYAVIRYEKYLFMYRIGGYVMYQMEPVNENSK